MFRGLRRVLQNALKRGSAFAGVAFFEASGYRVPQVRGQRLLLPLYGVPPRLRLGVNCVSARGHG